MFGQLLPRLHTEVPQLRTVNESFTDAKKRIRLVRKLGQGAFGAAYAATLQGRPVIVKTAVGTPGVVSLPGAIASMAREVRVLMRLQKFPFVPRLVEAGRDYFVQEDVGGVSMLHLLKQRGMEAREILSVVVSSGIILSQIHKAGVAHRDFAPRNILLTPQGVVVIDFGLAVIRNEDGERGFRVALEMDIIGMLENVALAMTAKDIPSPLRLSMASTIEDYRKIVVSGKVNDETAANLSRELLFVLAQVGAMARRGRPVSREKIKVTVA